jgi:hypothetical protein
MTGEQKNRLPRWMSLSQLVPLGGIAAAVFIAVVVNVLASRHFRRWDWTRGKLYTLSPATLDTLHDLPDIIEIWVLLGSSDPLALSVKQLLVSYSAESPRLDIHYVDPDKDALQLLDVRRRFKIEAERAQDGRVVTDASLVVARGDRHWFIGSGDLVEITEADDTRAKPKEEQALTGAIRNVLVGDKARLCFTTGHGEMSVSDPGPRGVGLLGGLLEKDNYLVVEVDPKDPGTATPFKDCAVVVVAAPQAPFTPDEETRLRAYVMTGGSLFAALQPIAAVSDTGLVAPGIAGALSPFGIVADDDVIIEQDPTDMVPGQMAAFTVTAKPHAVTASLVKSDKKKSPPRVLVLAPRSLRATKDGVTPVEVLSTSGKAFGVTNVTGASSWPPEGPEKTARDLAGPLAVAMASERPKLTTKSPHGPRAFVVGTGSVLQPINWTAAAGDRGAAFVVENAISWLAARPVVLDVPEKPAGVAAIHVSEDSRAGVWRYVLLYVPGAAALLGIAVALRRRSTEGREWKGPGDTPDPKGDPADGSSS